MFTSITTLGALLNHVIDNIKTLIGGRNLSFNKKQPL